MNVVTKEQAAEKYQIEVRYSHELEEVLKGFTGTLFINEGINSDSKLKTDLPDEKFLKSHTINRTGMHDILVDARVIKNDEEVMAMRWAS